MPHWRNRIRAWCKQHEVEPADLAKRFKMIEVSVNFMEPKDIAKLIRRAWLGFIEQPWEGYTSWLDTNDFHPEHVIHGDSWWEDTNGNWPDVENCICMEMELVDPNDEYPFIGKVMGKEVGRYKPRMERDWTVNHYAPHLKKTGQGNIWVFKSHCRMGTDGVQTIPALAEFREFIAAARDIQPMRMFKGQIAKVDWFGPFRPCMEVPDHAQGGWQKEFIEQIRSHLRGTDITGEADDFCVRAGTGQCLEYYESDPAVLARVNFISDCTSAIFPDDPAKGQTGNADHRAKMVKAGVKMINHDAPFQAV